MKFNGKTDEYLILSDIGNHNCHVLKEKIDNSLSMLWSLDDDNYINIDGVDYNIPKHQILCLTEFHKVKIKSIQSAKLVRFNRPFYCIADHDKEVGCKGILFFGAAQVPIINIPDDELEKFEILWKMFSLEMQSKDNLQIEMLQMMLKRLIILVTRLFKEQYAPSLKNNVDLDIVREFNYLVESHFKEYRSVSEYAQLLNKSPKTLSNLFSKYNSKTPLQIIQERLLLEARRLLQYTNLSIKEVAYELGYDDVQSFSRFFKTKEGIAPTLFKEKVA